MSGRHKKIIDSIQENKESHKPCKEKKKSNSLWKEINKFMAGKYFTNNKFERKIKE